MGLGPELISSQQNRDFSISANVGNWLFNTSGTSTLTYSPTDIGGADNKQALLNSVGVDSLLYASLDIASYCPLTAYRKYRFSAKVYVPAANSMKQILISFAYITGDTLLTDNTPTLEGDTWTVVQSINFLGSDILGELLIGFNGFSQAGDLLYFDDVSVRQVTSSGLTGQSMGMGL